MSSQTVLQTLPQKESQENLEGTQNPPAGAFFESKPIQKVDPLYKWVTGDITILIGVITLRITGRGAPCIYFTILLISQCDFSTFQQKAGGHVLAWVAGGSLFLASIPLSVRVNAFFPQRLLFQSRVCLQSTLRAKLFFHGSTRLPAGIYS